MDEHELGRDARFSVLILLRFSSQANPQGAFSLGCKLPGADRLAGVFVSAVAVENRLSEGKRLMEGRHYAANREFAMSDEVLTGRSHDSSREPGAASTRTLHLRSNMVYLTRKAEFSASHYYHNPEFSAEENQRIFGKCNNPNGHGHNYTLEVTVKGEVDPRSGFVVDLKQLKETMSREVLEALDHRFLNKEVPEFFTRIPTTENLAIVIWQRLSPKLKAAQLHRVRVYETPDLFVDFYGEA